MVQKKSKSPIERRTGVALWRQIADMIRLGITSDLADDAGKLPPEVDLAARYGVNRHTIRAAIAALAQEGVLRAEQGRGTYAIRRRRLAYPISKRTRFSTGLQGQIKSRSGKLLETQTEASSPEIAEALGIEAGAQVVRIESVSIADDVAISRGTAWFDAVRFPDIGARIAKTISITATLASFGIEDYVRKSTAIEARHASVEDTHDLGLSPGAIVLVTRAINTDLDGNPIQYAITRFAADRIELQVESDS